MPPLNLLDINDIPQVGERFDLILQQRNLVIERIVSSDKITPTLYVQSQDEWVVLLQGEAILIVGNEPVHLKPGDHLFLPAGTPHQVEQTSHGAVWLAIHLHPDHAVNQSNTPPTDQEPSCQPARKT